ncbi:hypothetical protein BT69DRAFT_1258863 [Atractiella rhizophila]|nr:hypothetical protein BT69DRAFT_1258863 [Atractiella rhizophila]
MLFSTPVLLSIISLSWALPIPKRQANVFQFRDYANFQISDGVAGNALAEAQAVFLTPIAGLSLSSISDTDRNTIESMRQLAEAAETEQFNPAIDAAGGTNSAQGEILQRGKIKNKVLKLTAELLVNQIKQAQGDDTQSKIDETQTKLNNNVAQDKDEAGQPSQGVTGGSAGAAVTNTNTTNDAPAEDVAASNAATTSSGASTFQLLDYAAFQISDGVAGNAKAEADAVFADKFAGVDLATVSETDTNNVETMRQAAEAAETEQFNPAIDAAGGTNSAQGEILQRGKIKNKVLKLSAELLVNQIKLAQGQDTQSKIDETQTKLNNNIQQDTAEAGQPSQGVTGGSAGAAAANTSTSNNASNDNAAASTNSNTGNTGAADNAATSAASTAAASTGGSTFQLLDYAAFQISDGVAGNAKAEADAVFADKFAGVDLATVSETDKNNVEAMRKAAENAETEQFNPAIDAGTNSAQGEILQRGKIKNKVLKLSGLLLVNQIKLAQGEDTQAAIDDAQYGGQTKLNSNIQQDTAEAGQPSKGVA